MMDSSDESTTLMNPEVLFVSQLPVIETILRFTCRRFGLSGADAEDFASFVKLKLIEDNYSTLRRFEGRSSLSTYLTTVIVRLYFDYRVRIWGKWRPSAEARRLGPDAVTLERLIFRDNYTFREACELMPEVPAPELERLYERLPYRAQRPKMVSIETLEDDTSSDPEANDDDLREEDSPAARQKRLPTAASTAPDDIGLVERHSTAIKVGRILDEVTANLAAEDQAIIRMRFVDCLKVPEIARILDLDMKKLYKRIDKILLIFRAALASQHIDSTDVSDLISHGDIEEELHLPNVRTIKSADIPGIYVDPGTARRTLQELLRNSEPSRRRN
jgi:RNA polymerase sigma factor for flagellar operon FliA